MPAQSQGLSVSTPLLPAPGSMIGLTNPMTPVHLRGLKIDPHNPFQMEFIINPGDSNVGAKNFSPLKERSHQLIKYFLAALTTPEDEIWVNLSPHEPDRIVPKQFGETQMGRDLLAQDYLLKQLTASLLHPDTQSGQEFWNRVYKQAYAQFGITDIPVDTFHKIWIMPESADIFEYGTSVVIENAKLKVKLDKEPGLDAGLMNEIILPLIEQEVNEGEGFAHLRQIYHALILATWFKNRLKKNIINQVYSNSNKVDGLQHTTNTLQPNKIYDQYLKAFETGVANFIREEIDPATGEEIPRKYFTGGFMLPDNGMASLLNPLAQLSYQPINDFAMKVNLSQQPPKQDNAMTIPQLRKALEQSSREGSYFHEGYVKMQAYLKLFEQEGFHPDENVLGLGLGYEIGTLALASVLGHQSIAVDRGDGLATSSDLEAEMAGFLHILKDQVNPAEVMNRIDIETYMPKAIEHADFYGQKFSRFFAFNVFDQPKVFRNRHAMIKAIVDAMDDKAALYLTAISGRETPDLLSGGIVDFVEELANVFDEYGVDATEAENGWFPVAYQQGGIGGPIYKLSLQKRVAHSPEAIAQGLEHAHDPAMQVITPQTRVLYDQNILDEQVQSFARFVNAIWYFLLAVKNEENIKESFITSLEYVKQNSEDISGDVRHLVYMLSYIIFGEDLALPELINRLQQQGHTARVQYAFRYLSWILSVIERIPTDFEWPRAEEVFHVEPEPLRNLLSPEPPNRPEESLAALFDQRIISIERIFNVFVEEFAHQNPRDLQAASPHLTFGMDFLIRALQTVQPYYELTFQDYAMESDQEIDGGIMRILTDAVANGASADDVDQLYELFQELERDFPVSRWAMAPTLSLDQMPRYLGDNIQFFYSITTRNWKTISDLEISILKAFVQNAQKEVSEHVTEAFVQDCLKRDDGVFDLARRVHPYTLEVLQNPDAQIYHHRLHQGVYYYLYARKLLDLPVPTTVFNIDPHADYAGDPAHGDVRQEHPSGFFTTNVPVGINDANWQAAAIRDDLIETGVSARGFMIGEQLRWFFWGVKKTALGRIISFQITDSREPDGFGIIKPFVNPDEGNLLTVDLDQFGAGPMPTEGDPNLKVFTPQQAGAEVRRFIQGFLPEVSFDVVTTADSRKYLAKEVDGRWIEQARAEIGQAFEDHSMEADEAVNQLRQLIRGLQKDFAVQRWEAASIVPTDALPRIRGDNIQLFYAITARNWTDISDDEINILKSFVEEARLAFPEHLSDDFIQDCLKRDDGVFDLARRAHPYTLEVLRDPEANIHHHRLHEGVYYYLYARQLLGLHDESKPIVVFNIDPHADYKGDDSLGDRHENDQLGLLTWHAPVGVNDANWQAAAIRDDLIDTGISARGFMIDGQLQWFFHGAYRDMAGQLVSTQLTIGNYSNFSDIKSLLANTYPEGYESILTVDLDQFGIGRLDDDPDLRVFSPQEAGVQVGHFIKEFLPEVPFHAFTTADSRRYLTGSANEQWIEQTRLEIRRAFEDHAMESHEELEQRVLASIAELLEGRDQRRLNALREFLIAQWNNITPLTLPESEDELAAAMQRLSIAGAWRNLNAYERRALKALVEHARAEFPNYLTDDIIAKGLFDSRGFMGLVVRSHPYTLQALRNPDDTTHHYRRHEGMYYWLYAMHLLGRMGKNPIIVMNVDPHDDHQGGLNSIDKRVDKGGENFAHTVYGVTDANWETAMIRDHLADIVIVAGGQLAKDGSLDWGYGVVFEQEGEIISAPYTDRVNDHDKVIELVDKVDGEADFILTVDLDQFAPLSTEYAEMEPIFFDPEQVKEELLKLLGPLREKIRMSHLITADSRGYLLLRAHEGWIEQTRAKIKEAFEDPAMEALANDGVGSAKRLWAAARMNKPVDDTIHQVALLKRLSTLNWKTINHADRISLKSLVAVAQEQFPQYLTEEFIQDCLGRDDGVFDLVRRSHPYTLEALHDPHSQIYQHRSHEGVYYYLYARQLLGLLDNNTGRVVFNIDPHSDYVGIKSRGDKTEKFYGGMLAIHTPVGVNDGNWHAAILRDDLAHAGISARGEMVDGEMQWYFRVITKNEDGEIMSAMVVGIEESNNFDVVKALVSNQGKEHEALLSVDLDQFALKPSKNIPNPHFFSPQEAGREVRGFMRALSPEVSFDRFTIATSRGYLSENADEKWVEQAHTEIKKAFQDHSMEGDDDPEARLLRNIARLLTEQHERRSKERMKEILLQDWNSIVPITLPETEDKQVSAMRWLSVVGTWENMEQNDRRGLKAFVDHARKKIPQYLTDEIIAMNLASEDGVMNLVGLSHPYTLQALSNPDQITHHYRSHEGVYYWLYAMHLLGRMGNNPTIVMNVDVHDDHRGGVNSVDKITDKGGGRFSHKAYGITDANWETAIIRDNLADLVVVAGGRLAEEGGLKWSYDMVFRERGAIMSAPYANSFNDHNKVIEFFDGANDIDFILTVDLDQFAPRSTEYAEMEPIFFEPEQVKEELLKLLGPLREKINMSHLITADSRGYLLLRAHEGWIEQTRAKIKEAFEDPAMSSTTTNDAIRSIPRLWANAIAQKLPDDTDALIRSIQRLSALTWEEVDYGDVVLLKSLVTVAQNRFPQYLTPEFIQDCFTRNDGVFDLVRRSHPYTLQVLANPTQKTHHFLWHEGAYYQLFAHKLLGIGGDTPKVIVNVDAHDDHVGTEGHDGIGHVVEGDRQIYTHRVKGVTDANWHAAAIRDDLAERGLLITGQLADGVLGWWFTGIKKDDKGDVVSATISLFKPNDFLNVLRQLHTFGSHDFYLTVDLDQFALEPTKPDEKPIFFMPDQVEEKMFDLITRLRVAIVFSYLTTADSREYLLPYVDEQWIQRTRQAIKNAFGDNAMPAEQRERLAYDLEKHYTLNSDIVASRAEQIRDHHAYVSEVNGKTVLFSRGNRKLVEISKLGSRRYFDFHERFILNLDPFDTVTEQIEWGKVGKFERFRVLHPNGKYLVNAVDEDGLFRGGGSRVYGIRLEDSKHLNLVLGEGINFDFMNFPGNIPTAYPDRREGEGTGVIILNIVSMLAQDRNQPLIYRGQISTKEFAHSLADVSDFNSGAVSNGVAHNAQPFERIFNPNGNVVYVRDGIAKRVYHKGQVHINGYNHEFPYKVLSAQHESFQLLDFDQDPNEVTYDLLGNKIDHSMKTSVTFRGMNGQVISGIDAVAVDWDDTILDREKMGMDREWHESKVNLIHRIWYGPGTSQTEQTRRPINEFIHDEDKKGWRDSRLMQEAVVQAPNGNQSGMSSADIHAALHEAYGSVVRQYQEQWSASPQDYFIEGVYAWLMSVARNDIPIHLVSNNEFMQAFRLDRIFKLDRLFESVTAPENFGDFNKTDVLREFNQRYNKVIMAGDSRLELEQSQQAGVEFIAVAHGEEEEAFFASRNNGITLDRAGGYFNALSVEKDHAMSTRNVVADRFAKIFLNPSVTYISKNLKKFRRGGKVLFTEIQSDTIAAWLVRQSYETRLIELTELVLMNDGERFLLSGNEIMQLASNRGRSPKEVKEILVKWKQYDKGRIIKHGLLRNINTSDLDAFISWADGQGFRALAMSTMIKNGLDLIIKQGRTLADVEKRVKELEEAGITDKMRVAELVSYDVDGMLDQIISLERAGMNNVNQIAQLIINCETGKIKANYNDAVVPLVSYLAKDLKLSDDQIMKVIPAVDRYHHRALIASARHLSGQWNLQQASLVRVLTSDDLGKAVRIIDGLYERGYGLEEHIVIIAIAKSRLYTDIFGDTETPGLIARLAEIGLRDEGYALGLISSVTIPTQILYDRIEKVRTFQNNHPISVFNSHQQWLAAAVAHPHGGAKISLSDFVYYSRMQLALQAVLENRAQRPSLEGQKLKKAERSYVKFRTYTARKATLAEWLDLIPLFLDESEAQDLSRLIQEEVRQDREILNNLLVRVRAPSLRVFDYRKVHVDAQYKDHMDWTDEDKRTIALLTCSWDEDVRHQVREVIVDGYLSLVDFYARDDTERITYALELLRRGALDFRAYAPLLTNNPWDNNYLEWYLRYLLSKATSYKIMTQNFSVGEKEAASTLAYFHRQYRLAHDEKLPPSEWLKAQAMTKGHSPETIDKLMGMGMISLDKDTRGNKTWHELVEIEKRKDTDVFLRERVARHPKSARIMAMGTNSLSLLRELPADQRAILQDHFEEGMAFDELAHAHSTSPENIAALVTTVVDAIGQMNDNAMATGAKQASVSVEKRDSFSDHAISAEAGNSAERIADSVGSDLGGIDFNPEHLQLNAQNATGINCTDEPEHVDCLNFEFTPAQIQHMQENITGFYPIIIDFTPIHSLPVFLGMEETSSLERIG